MGQSIRKPRSAPGTAGGRRDQPDKVIRRQQVRANDRRIKQAEAMTKAQADALEARIARERKAADEMEAARIANLTVERRLNARKQADLAAEKRQQWTLGEARDLVRQGYSIEHTVSRTGWPVRMLRDVEVGEW